MVTGNNLEINSVMKSDEGIFRCEATNSFGTSLIMTTLNVVGKYNQVTSIVEDCSIANFCRTSIQFVRSHIIVVTVLFLRDAYDYGPGNTEPSSAWNEQNSS